MDRHESAAGSSLEAAVRLIAAFARHANDGVMVTAAAPIFTDSVIVHVNPAFAGLTGYDPTEITGHPIHRLCVLAPERDRLERLSEALARGESVFGLILTRAKDGSDLALEWRISALYGDGGARIAWIVHMNAQNQRDSRSDLPAVEADGQSKRINVAMQGISASKSAEQALRVAKDDAERANRGKSRFLAAASHDLRQPLHALELLHAVLSESPLPKETRPIVLDMGESLDAMGRILNALLDISELEAGAVTPRVEDFPVDHLLTRLESEHRHFAKENGVALRVMPSSAIIRSDPDLIERIMGNFLSNAIRYTNQGRVLLGCRRRAGSLRIEVLDRGPGIPQDEIDGLFEEFRQLEVVAASRDNGLGLGLAIAKRLATLLSHKIHVDSIPGKGSQFAVEVPLGEAQRPERAQDIRPEPSGHNLNGAEVILIEDDLAVATATQRFLEAWGCRVTTVASGGQALSALEDLARPPDLIIADYRLPEGRSGMDVIAQLQGDHIEGVPALIVTGDTSPESLETLSKCGYSVLHKPVRPAKLRALVSHLLSKRATKPNRVTAAKP
jgi:PAS domain S-box-containing protein